MKQPFIDSNGKEVSVDELPTLSLSQLYEVLRVTLNKIEPALRPKIEEAFQSINLEREIFSQAVFAALQIKSVQQTLTLPDQYVGTNTMLKIFLKEIEEQPQPLLSVKKKHK